MEKTVKQIAQSARDAAIQMAAISTEKKNLVLTRIATALLENKESILDANRQDLENAQESGLAEPLVKRLVFGEEKLQDVIKGLGDLCHLPDPIGQTTYQNQIDTNRPGLKSHLVISLHQKPVS